MSPVIENDVGWLNEKISIIVNTFLSNFSISTLIKVKINILCQLETSLSGADWSRLTIRQADLRATPLHRVSLAYANLTASAFAELLGSILRLTISPDGAVVAATGQGSTLYLWEASTGHRLYTISAHNFYIPGVCFSPDSTLLATGGFDHTIRLWDVATGKCLQTWQMSGVVWGLVFNQAGTILASGFDDSTLRLWDLQTQACLHVLKGHTAQVRGMSFNADGTLLASASFDGTIKIWDVATGRCLQTLTEHVGAVWDVAFRPDDAQLVSIGFDGTAKLWHPQTWECLQNLVGHTGLITGVTYSPDGTTLYTASHDGTIRVWDSATGQCLRVFQGHTRIWDVALSPTQNVLVIAQPSSQSACGEVRAREIASRADIPCRCAVLMRERT